MRTAVAFLLLVLVGAGAVFGYQKFGAWQSGRLVQWRADSARVADATRAATLAAATKDTVHLRAKKSYQSHRDQVISSGSATSRERETFAKCDEVVRTCDERHTADSIVAASLRAELAVARARPIDRPKRLQVWTEGAYDVLSAAPVLRAGVELRILGGIHAGAAADVAIPSAAECSAGRCVVRTRALLGIRYVF